MPGRVSCQGKWSLSERWYHGFKFGPDSVTIAFFKLLNAIRGNQKPCNKKKLSRGCVVIASYLCSCSVLPQSFLQIDQDTTSQPWFAHRYRFALLL